MSDNDEPHYYLSTGCFHELHNKCRLRCKYCDQFCSCECHEEVL